MTDASRMGAKRLKIGGRRENGLGQVAAVFFRRGGAGLEALLQSIEVQSGVVDAGSLKRKCMS